MFFSWGKLMPISSHHEHRKPVINSLTTLMVGFLSLLQCMCSGCAKVLRFQTDRCPICRQPVERLLEIKVSNGPDE